MRKGWLWAAVLVLLCSTMSVAMAQPRGPAPPGGPPGPGFDLGRLPLMAALDANGDGEVSAEEIANAPQALKKLDTNGDGKLSRDELRPAFAGRGGPGGRPGMGPGGGQASSFWAPPRAKDDAEQKILQVLDELNNQRRGMMNVPVEDGRMLRLLTEAVSAKTVVEIGTSNGYSGIWFCLALRKTGGKLITHDIDAQRAALARQNFAKAGVSELVTLVEGDAHQTITKLQGPIDVVFIDADKEGYLDYLQKMLPLLRPGGLILAHNMVPRMANAEFVKAITTNPDLETVFFMEGGGLGITLKKR